MGVDIQRTDEGAISFHGLQPDSLPSGGTRLILIVDPARPPSLDIDHRHSDGPAESCDS
jgi:hypothetical protein